jgi:large subunit ribosomal protein L18
MRKKLKNPKAIARKRRIGKYRAKARELNVIRLCVHKTPKHIYAQVIQAGASDKVLASVSTLTPEVRKKLQATGNVDAAKIVGDEIAKAAIKAGVKRVSFDRAGYPYHGRVKALAEQAREGGLEF